MPQNTTNPLELLFGAWLLCKIHPRGKHKHHSLEELRRRLKELAEEDDDAEDEADDAAADFLEARAPELAGALGPEAASLTEDPELIAGFL